MKEIMLLYTMLLPLVCGLVLYFIRLRSYRAVCIFVMTASLVTSVLGWFCILGLGRGALEIFRFNASLVLELRLDGLGRFFTAIIVSLWPLTSLYAFEYMRREERQKSFFAFFLMAYFAALGVAMAANMFTMYCFYELLTLTTVPLIVHVLTPRAIRAARTYMIVSFGGAAFAFLAMVFLLLTTGTLDFQYCGNLQAGTAYTSLFYIFGFLGFGVKAAVFPMHYWLPRACVAPTPVTALLHAVAVVKSGVFAIMRLTWYSFGPAALIGTPGQYVAAGFAVFTIVFGSSMALRDGHFKRRMAYSTVANLSYILYGVTLMTPAGFSAGLLHMLCHAVIKICSFFCVGAVLHNTEREFVTELDGLGRKMPVTFAAFTVSALALSGIPPLNGFFSKFALLTAGAAAATPLAYIGIAALLISALLTAIYMFNVAIRAFFPPKTSDLRSLDGIREVSWQMTVPILMLCAAILVTGLAMGPISAVTDAIAAGLR